MLISWLIIGAVGDVVTTMMCYYKAPYDNESAPIHLGNIYVTMLIKIILYVAASWILISWYLGIEQIIIRYFVVYMMLLACLLQTGAIYGNIQYFMTPSEHIVQADKEQLKEAYAEMIFDAGIINPGKIPVLFLFIPINLLQFIFWRSFEKWRNQSILNKDNYTRLAYA